MLKSESGKNMKFTTPKKQVHKISSTAVFPFAVRQAGFS